MSSSNANTKYAYTREGSSAYFPNREKSFTELESQPRNNGLTGITSAASPNTKWLIVAIVAVVAVILVVCIPAILLTRQDDKNEASDPDKFKMSTPVSTDTTSSASSTTPNVEPTSQANTDTTSSTIPNSTSTTTGTPLLDTWLQWNDWLSCSVTCGLGIHTRYRSCEDGAYTCNGDYIEFETCTESDCPVYGKWSTWESWGSCTSSCGGGIQIRTRSCNTTDPNAFDCVGNNAQNRTCSNWNCPDCSQVCPIGTLNTECDTCICENNIVTGHVVSNRSGNFLGGVFVYANTAPTTLLTQSNTTGHFTLNATCVSTELLIAKDGFADTIVTVDENNTLEIQMAELALPYFTTTPRSKYRLAGETVSLCCNAISTPDIEYYEWLKDSLLIKTVDSSYDTLITLQDLTTSDSGDYQCRANSRSGAIMSQAARLDVKDNPDDFCENALQQKQISLPGDCVDSVTNSSVYEVGDCAAQRCRLNESNTEGVCGNETYSCCVPSDVDIRTVQCTGYEVQLFVVRACGCAECTAASLRISGTVVDFEDNSPVQYAEVWANSVFQTFTSGLGSFDFEPSDSVDQISIYIVDSYVQQYLPTTTVVQISPDMTGTIHVDIKLFKASDPVELDSAVPNTLVAGTSEQGSAIVQVEIPSNAFYNVDGTPYSGTVLASLTFLDPNDITMLDNFPGLLEFTDAEGQQGALDTYGVFNLYFRDSDGQPLTLGTDIDLYVPDDVGTGDDGEDIKLWRLNTEAGNWENVSPGSDERRKRRQIGSSFLGSITRNIRFEWFNYDRVQRSFANVACFYKIRLFVKEDLQTRVTVSSSTLNVRSTASLSNRVRQVKDWLYPYKNTEQKCFTAFCDDTYSSIYGYDYRFNYKTVLFSADTFPPNSNLNVDVTIADDELSVNAKMVRSTDGPFFSSQDVCLRSTDADPHLRMYYDRASNDWEVRKTFPSSPNLPIDTQLKMSQMAWYTESGNSFKACYLKVRIVMDGILSGSIVNLKLGATSFGGSVEGLAGNAFGGRFVNIESAADSTYCIEFKCSGHIGLEMVKDYTKVKVEFTNPVMTCEMQDTAGLSSDDDDTVQSDSTDGVLEFSAPIASGSEHGVYFAIGNKWQTAKTKAESTCNSGENELAPADPSLGVGITITCSRSCPAAAYFDGFVLYPACL